MRRIVLALTFVGLGTLIGGGVAFAAVRFGTESSDYLRGTGETDVLYGRGGSDSVAGMRGDDTIYGEQGGDALHGGSFELDEIFRGRKMVPDGEDRLFGGPGNDCVWGGSEDDILYGGDGDDFVGTYCLDFIMDTGEDIMYAGPGDDFVTALEAPFRYRNLQELDLVYCGPGRDQVYYQEGVDRVFDCEAKNPR